MAAITPEIVCRSRSMSLWTSACECPACTANKFRIYKARDTGTYRRVSVEHGLAALDAMIAKGYNGPAVASACGVNQHTAAGWVGQRKQGKTVKLGPVACYRLVRAGEPKVGRMHCWKGTRKLRALARIGWGVVELAAMMHADGLTDNSSWVTVSRVRVGHIDATEVSLLHAIDAIYSKLWMTPAASDRHHNRIREDARRAGWGSPLAWEDIEDPEETGPSGLRAHAKRHDSTRHKADVDPATVHRLCAGELKGIQPTTAERRAAVAQLRAEGNSDAEIERITGIAKVNERYPREVKIDA